MYTLLIGDDNRIISTIKERIVQRSKLVNSIRIIVPEEYNGISMKECLAILYYQLPISKEWDSKELTASEELYKERYVEYIIPVDTWLTKEYGDVNIEVAFYNVSMDGNIDINQYVRKATNGSIHISSSKDWAASIADPILNTIDQRIIQLQILQNRQTEMMEEAKANSAESLLVEDSKLYLVDAQGNKKGEPADVVIPRVADDFDGSNDGLLEVDDSAPTIKEDNGCDCGCDHEFVELDNNSTGNKTDSTTDDNAFLEL